MRVADAGPVAAALRNERSTAIATSTTPRSESRARSVASMSLSAFPSPGFVCEPARPVSKSVRPLRPSAVVVRPDRSAPFGEYLEVIVVSVSRDGPSRSAGPLVGWYVLGISATKAYPPDYRVGEPDRLIEGNAK